MHPERAKRASVQVRGLRRRPVTTMSTSRLPHCEHTSRSRHSGTGISAPSLTDSLFRSASALLPTELSTPAARPLFLSFALEEELDRGMVAGIFSRSH